jgi:nucleoside 2-deoxyribosyltransferase
MTIIRRNSIFSRCKSHLDDADRMIALLDGPQVDDETAWEIGYFCAKKSSEQKIIPAEQRRVKTPYKCDDLWSV